MDRKAIEQWSVVSKLLDIALDLPAPQRQAWLDGLNAQYAELKPVLIDLLANQAHLEHRELVTPSGASVHAAISDCVELESLVSGQLIGAYRLQKEIGRGGMADVWLAERADGAFERQVALKLPHLNHTRRDLIARFMRERNILAPLEHPYIARLYDAGVSSDGLPYLAMEYVDGQTITHYSKEKKLDVPEKLKLFLQVLDAVQFAHEHLVIHRDLKPSNILVTNQGEVRLLDFGIAKLLGQDNATSETQLTQVVGRALTLDYASPEQVRGESLTTASDVYSLGVILYELLTGERPYRLKITTPAQLEQAIVDSEPTMPSARIMLDATKETRDVAKRRAKILTGDLDTITMKALQKKTVARYGSASELALELNRYLAYEPIRAKPESRWYAFKKFVRRNRLAVAGSAALVASLFAGLVGTLWQAGRAEEAAAYATVEARRANEEAAGKQREALRANAAADDAIAQRRAAEEATQSAKESLRATETARANEAAAAEAAKAAELSAKSAATATEKQRDIAIKQLNRAQALNELNIYLLNDASPAKKPLTTGELMVKAENLIETQHATNPVLYSTLMLTIGHEYQSMGQIGKSSNLLRKAYERAQSTDDTSLRAHAACTWGYANALSGKIEDARTLFKESDEILAIWPDKGQEMGCLLSKARFERRFGSQTRSISQFEQFSAYAKSTSSHVSYAKALIDLSQAYYVNSRYSDALATSEKAYNELSRLGRGETFVAGVALNQWANALGSMGRPREAQKVFERDFALGRASEGSDQISASTSLDYALAHTMMQEFDSTIAIAQRVQAVAANNSNFLLQARAEILMARAFAELGEHDRATFQLDSAEAWMKKSLQADNPLFRSVASLRGLISSNRGNYERAITYFDFAARDGEFRRTSSVPLATTLSRRSAAYLAIGRVDDAVRDAKESVEIMMAGIQKQGFSSEAGHSYRALANALMQVDKSEAKIAYERALAHFSATLGAEHALALRVGKILASF